MFFLLSDASHLSIEQEVLMVSFFFEETTLLKCLSQAVRSTQTSKRFRTKSLHLNYDEDAC